MQNMSVYESVFWVVVSLAFAALWIIAAVIISTRRKRKLDERAEVYRLRVRKESRDRRRNPGSCL